MMETRIFTEYRLQLLPGQLPDASSHFSEARLDLLDDINSSGERQLSLLEGSDCILSDCQLESRTPWTLLQT